MAISIEKFIEELSNEKNLENVLNHYSSNWKFDHVTRNNLRQYLMKMKEVKPSIMLVGEAPGYKGCKLTGIPFTSEKLIAKSEKFQSKLGLEYIICDEKKPSGEATATIMWEAFEKYEIYPLLWNAFPFHPHKINHPESNRKPLIPEIEIGMKYIEYLVEMYDIKEIYAIGKVAHSALANMGMNVLEIRHPANGGKKEFMKGIEAISKY